MVCSLGALLESSSPVLRLMSVSVPAHPCWEPFWSESFIGSEGEVTYFTQFRYSHGKPNKPRFLSGLSWNDRSRRERFCQRSQQGEDSLRFSYSSPSFCVCHQHSPALNSGSLSKLQSKSTDVWGKLGKYNDSPCDRLWGIEPFTWVYTKLKGKITTVVSHSPKEIQNGHIYFQFYLAYLPYSIVGIHSFGIY